MAHLLAIPTPSLKCPPMLTSILGLISYSEATRYTPQKYQQTVQWCKAHHKPVPQHALYPRTKGFVATVKALRGSSSVTAVYDLTLAYAHKNQFLQTPSMWETLSQPRLNENWRFHVHVERFALNQFIDKTDAELASWLEERWLAKSKLLQGLKDDLDHGREWPDVESDPQDKKNS